MISIREAIMAAVGLLLVAVITPIGMGQILVGYNTSWNSAVSTMFSVLLPILYIIGVALYFLPKIGK